MIRKHATVHLVNARDENRGPADEPTIELLEEKYPGISARFVRGDIIEDVSVHGYRSQGVYFWDGEKIIPQDTEDDPYGMVPKVFSYGEFPPGYWDTDSTGISVIAWEPGTSTEFYWHIDPPIIGMDMSDRYPLDPDTENITVRILGTDYDMIINSAERFNYEQKNSGYVSVYWNGSELVYEVEY